MRHLGIAFLVAALALTLETPTGDIQGTVRFQDGSPLPFASVVILGTSMVTMTHQDGSFAFDGVPVGLARLRVTAAGWRGEKYHMVNVIAGTMTRADVQLTGHDLVREGIVGDPELSVPAARAALPTGTIKGIVRDADTYAPVPYVNARVVSGPRIAMTDSNGEFVIEGIEPGTVRFMASMPLYTTTILDSVVVAAGDMTWLDVRIMRAWPVPLFPDDPIAAPSADARPDPLRPFVVQLPFGWFAEAADYSVMHYRDVFAIVNNRSPDLRVTDKRLPNGWTNSLDTVAEQLEPGTVYIDFAFFEGPGRSARYRPGREDSFDRELAAFLKNPKANSTSALDEYVLNFIKWGSQWDVRIHCRKPYSDQDRKLAFEMLRSVRFFERPIVNSAQAVGLAIQFLPPEAQIPKDSDDLCGAGEAWLANGGLQGNRSTRVTKTEEGFEVTFVLHEDNHGEGQLGEWRYLVRWDGGVESR